MLTPGRKPQFKDQFGKAGEKIGDLFDGKSDYEKRKKLNRKLKKLKGATGEKAKNKRASLQAELADLNPKKAREARLAKEAKIAKARTKEPMDPEALKMFKQVKWKDSKEYTDNTFDVDTPVYSSPVKVEDGHLGLFTNADLASVPGDRYSRMDGGGDVMKSSGLQLFETGLRNPKVSEQVKKTLTDSGIYGKVELEQIGGGYVLESEELGKQYKKLSRIYIYDREDGLVDVSDATGAAPKTYKDLGAFLKRQGVNLPARPVSAPQERSALNGLVKNRVEYAEREDGAIVGRGRGMSDAPVAVLRTAGKNPEYHYSIRYRDTEQLIFDNLEDLLDFHSEKTGYNRDMLSLKYSPDN